MLNEDFERVILIEDNIYKKEEQYEFENKPNKVRESPFQRNKPRLNSRTEISGEWEFFFSVEENRESIQYSNKETINNRE